jgi:DNA-binding FrmR family transcriptional regulator
MRHQSHPDILTRLKKAVGHLNSVISMMEDSRPCLDLAQQLHAVESAVTNAKRLLIHDHMEHCLNGPASDAKAALKELKQLTKYL